MADYSQFVALAQRLIAARGRAVTMRELADSSADASKPWKGTGAPTVKTEVPTVAVFLPSKGTDISTIVKDDDLLKRVTDVALVAPGAVDLRNMTHIVDGKVYKIEWAQVLEPGDTVCLFAFGVTR